MMTIKPGDWTMRNGNGVVLVRGKPGGRQNPSGSSFPIPARRCFNTSAAQGCMGMSLISESVLLLIRRALGAQGPDRSGLPSARRGTGPAGGHPGLGMNPNTGCAKISSCAAAGAAVDVNPIQTAHATPITLIGLLLAGDYIRLKNVEHAVERAAVVPCT